MPPLGVSFHLLIWDQGLVCLPSWSHLILSSLCLVLGLCHSFKSCALPFSLLLHKEINPLNPKGNQLWIFIGKTDVEAETPILWPHDANSQLIGKRPWRWKKLNAGGEGDDRGWDGWMASPTQWTWVYVDSRSWWWTGTPGVLHFMGLQRVGHDWATELNWIV